MAGWVAWARLRARTSGFVALSAAPGARWLLWTLLVAASFGRSSEECPTLGLWSATSPSSYPCFAYQSLGCWQDVDWHVILPLDSSAVTGGSNIIECAAEAKHRGHPGFAMQDGGTCYSDGDMMGRYKVLGESTGCAGDGLGGTLASEVYAFLDYSALGCWAHVNGSSALSSLEGSDDLLSEDAASREYPIVLCASVAARQALPGFAIQEDPK
ncbi:hypothetical protein T484DRAFT_1760866 [Baffinella frigidus]|nr:hypothetical protein T484DRAFT_1760866 [Cryptophyta sp. CCMP2293]